MKRKETNYTANINPFDSFLVRAETKRNAVKLLRSVFASWCSSNGYEPVDFAPIRLRESNLIVVEI